MQCPDAHLFCKTCMSSYASNLLGEHNHNIVCMDRSGCDLVFPQSQLDRFLTPTLLDLYNRVKELKEIEAACLENLEGCPFCDYKCIIEDEKGTLFQCENCSAVSCRECKELVRIIEAFSRDDSSCIGVGPFTQELQAQVRLCIH